MTREEAKDFKKHRLIFRQSQIPFLRHIDKIYDDFESRVCENCKFVEAKNGDAHACDILMAFNKTQAERLIGCGFGCNKFKRREDV